MARIGRQSALVQTPCARQAHLLWLNCQTLRQSEAGDVLTEAARHPARHQALPLKVDTYLPPIELALAGTLGLTVRM